MATRSIWRANARLSPQWICQACRRAHSTPAAAGAPPLLLKLRNDLKTAMKAKDTNRLNVLRALLADVTNAAKTPSPITTDMQLLALLRKRSASAKAAGDEFKAAGRQDLTDREEGQARILEEYAGGVQTMSIERVRQAVQEVVSELRANDPALKAGSVMKALFAPGGKLDGQPVEKSVVPGLVKELLAPS